MTWEKQKKNEKSRGKTGSFVSPQAPAERSRRVGAAAGWPGQSPLRRLATAALRAPRTQARPGPPAPAAAARGAGAARPWGNHRHLHGDCAARAVPPRDIAPSASLLTQGAASRETPVRHPRAGNPARPQRAPAQPGAEPSVPC